jgi:hypothetical protein
MIRSPALHFVVLGTLLYGLRVLAGVALEGPMREVVTASIVVEADDLERMRRSYEQSIGGTPDQAAYDYMIERFAEDEMLYREALGLGLDRGDDTVRWRLIEKMQYLGEADETEADEDVFQRALRLGLHRDDPIIKDVLIDKYRMLVRYAYDASPITEEELRAYYERNKERFVNPQRTAFSHVFFSSQQRGDRAQHDAEAALAELRAGAVTDERGFALGDAFLSDHRIKHQTPQGIMRLFGEEFAEAIAGADEGRWTGPIKSAYGRHVVFVSARGGGGSLAFDSVRSQVLKAAEDERREVRLNRKIAELRKRYDIVVRRDGEDANGDA